MTTLRTLRNDLGWIAALILALTSACGDDADNPVSTGDQDAGHDAGLDASQPMDASQHDAQVRDAAPDAPPEDRTQPPDDEDAETPTCAQDCDALTTECVVAVCNETTLECELSNRRNGTACGSDVLDNCGAPDQCRNGVCDTRDAPEDTPCGDQGLACHRDDACDGHGACIDKGLLAVGSDCGDDASSECDAPDSCNAAGECVPNYAADDAPCGDQDETCKFDDTCDGSGHCVDHGLWEAGACPPGSTEHDGLCTCGRTGPITTCLPGPDVCVAGVCELGHEYFAPSGGTTDGMSCGSSANTVCDNPDVCNDGFCDTHAENAGTPCGSNADTACDDPDTCDGFGNCTTNYEEIDTICGDSPGVCFDAPHCNGSGTCQAGSARPGIACGDPNATACDRADVCDDLGNCSDNLAELGTACGDPPSGPCDAQDECNAVGQCIARLEPSGTVCGDADEECHVPDTCNSSGVCIDHGFVGSGQPCGSDGETECDHADTCNSSGTCLQNLEPAGTECGEISQQCMLPNTCSGDGSCTDGELDVGCPLSVNGTVVDEVTRDPIEGVTVEIIGSDPLLSAVSESDGTFVLDVPAGIPVALRAHATATHWGAAFTYFVLPTHSRTVSFALVDDATVDSRYAAPGLANPSTSLAIVNFEFEGSLAPGGGEGTALVPACASTTCGPVLIDEPPPVLASVLPAGRDELSLVNVPLASEITVHGAGAFNDCELPDGAFASLFAHTITSVDANCAEP